MINSEHFAYREVQVFDLWPLCWNTTPRQDCLSVVQATMQTFNQYLRKSPVFLLFHSSDNRIKLRMFHNTRNLHCENACVVTPGQPAYVRW